MKYELDKSSRKFNCPQCGKKRFVPYVNEQRQIIGEQYGRCDREQNCGYHKRPTDTAGELAIFIPSPPKEPDYIPNTIVESTLNHLNKNSLFKFMIKVMPLHVAVEISNRYMLGTTRDGSAAFWQIDKQGNARSGKIIKYLKDGHRDKSNFLPCKWAHKMLKIDNFSLVQCFFGEHLLTDDFKGTIAIVESEKTAMMMSYFKPEHLWLAAGGSNGLQMAKLKAVSQYELVFFADLGQYDKWKIVADVYNGTMDKELENVATEDMRERGDDILDLYLNKHTNGQI